MKNQYFEIGGLRVKAAWDYHTALGAFSHMDDGRAVFTDGKGHYAISRRRFRDHDDMVKKMGWGL